jgi:hypothetical protein
VVCTVCFPPNTNPLHLTVDTLPACAQNYLPEYGSNYQIHVQQPFDKLNLYTATLTILGEDEPLLHTKFCRTPVEALSNLRIMVMSCQNPGKKEELEELRREQAMREALGSEKESGKEESTEDCSEEQSSKELLMQESKKGLPGQRSKNGSLISIERARKIWEEAFGAEDELVDKEELAREQWEFTRAQLAGMKPRKVVERHK